jgi:YtxH-like protein
MNQVLKLLLRAGLSLLEPERVDALRDQMSDRVDDLGEKTRQTYNAASKHVNRIARVVRGQKEDHTLGNTLAFLAGIGTGIAVGMLFAPASGEETRNSLAGSAQGMTDKLRDRFTSTPEGNTGTYGS